MSMIAIKNPVLCALFTLLSTAALAQPLPSSSNSLTGSDRPQPLPPEQAFPYFVSISAADLLTVTWQIAPAHYLYRHRFEFALKRSPDAPPEPLAYSLPDGLQKWDEFFGDIEAYYQQVTASIELDTTELDSASLIIQYQGCAEWGFCYPPQSSEYRLFP